MAYNGKGITLLAPLENCNLTYARAVLVCKYQVSHFQHPATLTKLVTEVTSLRHGTCTVTSGMLKGDFTHVAQHSWQPGGPEQAYRYIHDILWLSMHDVHDIGNI